ncbi:MAG: fructose-6-phosphate aldolase [Bacteroidia bacterium]|nr:fructose-6-phosphate aldolase [Bacteroidia bacterium]
MYVLKIKGKARIPDYVQIRDNDFTLIAYFRLDRPEKAIAKLGLSMKEDEIMNQLNSMPYGKVIKIDW